MSASLARSAAIRTMPASKKTRASLSCSSEVGRGREQVARRQRHLVDHGPRGRGHDPGPLAVGDGDEAHPLERLHGLAHRRPPDAVLAHQVALGRQMIARRQLALGDPREQTVEDLMRQLAPPDRFAIDHPVVLARLVEV